MRALFAMGCLITLLPAPGRAAEPGCTADDIRGMSVDGRLATIDAACTLVAESGLPLSPEGAVPDLCADLRPLCRGDAAARAAVFETWLRAVGRLQRFRQAWTRQRAVCGSLPAAVKASDAAARADAYCADGMTEARAWTDHRAIAIALAEPSRSATFDEHVARAEDPSPPYRDPTNRGGVAAAASEWASVVAVALADFVTARLEAELDAFVVRRFTERVCVPAVRWAAENTCALLEQPPRAFLSVSFGAAFQAAVKRDVLALPQAAADRDRMNAPEQLPGKLSLTLVASLMRGDPMAEATRRLLAALAQVDSPKVKRALVVLEAAERCVRSVQGNKPIVGPCSASARRALESLLGRALTADETVALGAMIEAIVEARAAANDIADAIAATDETRRLTEAQLAALRQQLWSAVLRTFANAARLTDGAWDPPPGLIDLLVALEHRSLPEALAAIVEMLRHADDPLPGDALRLLAFGADLSAADDADEARAIIDTYAAPVGSWRLKYGERFTASLGALAGVSLGAEWLNGGAVLNSDAGLVYGLAAPIGVDLAFGLGQSWTLGVFVSVIDVGGLLSVRASETEQVDTADADGEAAVEATPEFDPRQLLAPGLLLRVGICDTPLTLGIGGVVAPYARDAVLPDGDAEADLTALRVQAVLGMDIPIIFF